MSTSEPQCIIDGTKASQATLFLINGAWLCASHASCYRCKTSLLEAEQPVHCNCGKYGSNFNVHDEATWCGELCMDASHDEIPEPIYKEEDEDDSPR